MDVPDYGTPEYRWWAQGASDEADARREGMSGAHLGVRDVLETMARYNPARPELDLVMGVARIYAAGAPLRQRIRHAWRLIR